jgi:hypothetical protein
VEPKEVRQEDQDPAYRLMMNTPSGVSRHQLNKALDGVTMARDVLMPNKMQSYFDGCGFGKYCFNLVSSRLVDAPQTVS